ncbi:MAG: SAM-dependent DNA methyltransferase [Deltaproteobacteria bacterium]|jgi:hypothetical protein|nr:SAM-dependent DNA methyltransferase [Deltaproteobacteria bacterium]
MKFNNHQQVKSKNRVVAHGEVLTAEREVNAMLDLVKDETYRIDSRFLEPACGNGNFLAEVLNRKLKIVKKRYINSLFEYEKYLLLAITSIYGVDILADNVADCIYRLFDIFDAEYSTNFRGQTNEGYRQAIHHILRHNILCGDALTMKTQDGNPIIFSEWSFVTGDLVKRRDFRFDELLQGHREQRNLFMQSWEYDDEIKAFIPLPIREFPPVPYTEVQNYD